MHADCGMGSLLLAVLPTTEAATKATSHPNKVCWQAIKELGGS